MKYGKVWGSTEPVLITPFIEVHRLWIKAHAQCSRHVHQYKYNAFLVLNGTLFIDVVKSAYKLTDTTVLDVGDFTTVKPNEEHWFRTEKEAVLAFEIYYPSPLGEDIVRKTCGSVKRR